MAYTAPPRWWVFALAALFAAPATDDDYEPSGEEEAGEDGESDPSSGFSYETDDAEGAADADRAGEEDPNVLDSEATVSDDGEEEEEETPNVGSVGAEPASVEGAVESEAEAAPATQAAGKKTKKQGPVRICPCKKICILVNRV